MRPVKNKNSSNYSNTYSNAFDNKASSLPASVSGQTSLQAKHLFKKLTVMGGNSDEAKEMQKKLESNTKN